LSRQASSALEEAKQGMTGLCMSLASYIREERTRSLTIWNQIAFSIMRDPNQNPVFA